MKRRIISSLMIATMALSLVACKGGSGSAESSEPSKETESSGEEASSEGTAEKPKVVWAQGNSGNVLVSIAKDKGYFDEVGVEVEEIPLDDGQLEAVRTGQVDIASTSSIIFLKIFAGPLS